MINQSIILAADFRVDGWTLFGVLCGEWKQQEKAWDGSDGIHVAVNDAKV